MKVNEWIEQVKIRLGFPVVEIYTPDDNIQKLVMQAIDKISTFLEECEFLTVQGPTVDLRSLNVYCVLGVYKTQMTSSMGSLSYVDEFALINYAPFLEPGGNIERMLLRNMYRSELDYLVPIDYELIDGKLFLSGIYGYATVKAITEKSLYKMSNTYQLWIVDYTLALLKQAEGLARRKFKISGSPVEIDGDALVSEGKTEQDVLEDKLGKTIGGWYYTR